MNILLFLVCFVQLARADRSLFINVINKTNATLLDLKVACRSSSSTFPEITPPLRRIESGQDPESTTCNLWSHDSAAFSFTFVTQDEGKSQVCYPEQPVPGLYHEHGLVGTDEAMTLRLETLSSGKLRYFFVSGYESSGNVYCEPILPLKVRVVNKLSVPLKDVDVVYSHEWVPPFEGATEVKWSHIDKNTTSDLSPAVVVPRRDVQIGVELQSDEVGFLCRIRRLTDGPVFRQELLTTVQDTLLVIVVSPVSDEIGFEIFTAHPFSVLDRLGDDAFWRVTAESSGTFMCSP